MQEIHQDELRRVPGLYRRWELPELLETGVVYQIEEAGETACGMKLVAVYRRSPDAEVAK